MNLVNCEINNNKNIIIKRRKLLLAKIHLDKYYTPPDLAKYIIDKTKLIIGEENITEYLEPSAWSGVFLDYLDELNLPYLAYDIEPEDDKNRIVEQDFLELDLEYKKGRCIIGNPPYGKGNTSAVKFYKKSIQLGDYISFILPASQLNNNQQMYEFDLIHSELISNEGFDELDNRVKLSFNIYKKNINGSYNNKPINKLKDVIIKENRRGENNNIEDNYDLGICRFGWNICKTVDYVGQYVSELYFYINNDNLRKKIVDIIINAKWEVIYPMTATPILPQWKIYKYLKEQIPEIK